MRGERVRGVCWIVTGHEDSTMWIAGTEEKGYEGFGSRGRYFGFNDHWRFFGRAHQQWCLASPRNKHAHIQRLVSEGVRPVIGSELKRSLSPSNNLIEENLLQFVSALFWCAKL